jgi:hypothetical protein
MKTEIDFGSSIVALIRLSNRLQKESADGKELEQMYETVLEIREASRILKELIRREYDK